MPTYRDLNRWDAFGRKAQDINTSEPFSTLRPTQNDHHFSDDILKHIFVNENVGIWIQITVKFFPRSFDKNNPVLGQIMALRRLADKPLSEPMMA